MAPGGVYVYMCVCVCVCVCVREREIERASVRSGDKEPAVNCHVGAQGSINAYQGSISGMSVWLRGDCRWDASQVSWWGRLNSLVEIRMESALCLITLLTEWTLPCPTWQEAAEQAHRAPATKNVWGKKRFVKNYNYYLSRELWCDYYYKMLAKGPKLKCIRL